MRLVQCLAFLLLSVFPVMAESVETQTNSTDSSVNPAAQASLPPTSQPQKVIDKKFIAVMAALGAAKGISFATRTLIREREREEGAPWPPEHNPTQTSPPNTPPFLQAKSSLPTN